MRAAKIFPLNRPPAPEPVAPPVPKPAQRWGVLSARAPKPVDVDDTDAKAKAASALVGMETRDGRLVYPGDLIPNQARDVIRWHDRKEAR